MGAGVGVGVGAGVGDGVGGFVEDGVGTGVGADVGSFSLPLTAMVMLAYPGSVPISIVSAVIVKASPPSQEKVAL